MPGDETVEIIFLVEVCGIVVPAAHVRPGCGQAFSLAEWFEQGIFVETQECGFV
jgi:hypothetical protein